jgi:2-polyprenyl-3-methyl-5-hydroxy-6-metoxy-1,4-benzoquinol methylase
MAKAGQAMIKGIPPNGKDYWAGRFWDRDSAERHPILSTTFLKQKETIGGYLKKYGENAKESYEFACGTGEFTRLTAENTPVAQMTAVDVSAEGIAMAKKRAKHDNLRFILGDFWADHGLGQVPLVVCVDAIHHLGDVREVLLRLKKFVEPGGVLIGNVITIDHFHEFERRRYGAIEHLGRTATFLGTATMIRLSGGRLNAGAYRTQLRTNVDLAKILKENFTEVLDISEDRYFTAFAVRV